MIDLVDEGARKKVLSCVQMAKALRSSMDSALAASPDDVWKHAGFRLFARKYNEILTATAKFISIEAPLDYAQLDKMPGLGDSWGLQQKEYFEAIHANLSILIAYLEQELGVTHDELEALKDFLQARLRQAIFEEPAKESEVQDAIEALLIGRGLQKGTDYDRETGRTKISVKEVVPDFVFPRLSLALEVKLSKEPSKLGTLVDQINADIRSYSTRYERIIFLVYDLGTIRNETEFKSGLEMSGKVSVLVVKH
jgi:hypothetical protein